MDKIDYTIRNASPDEYEMIGSLMTEVYAQLDGFPKQQEQPEYYQLLSNVEAWTTKPDADILVAKSCQNAILGAVIYFNDMQYYGSGGSASTEKNAAGFRLLAVHASARNKGIGRLLVTQCIRKAKEANRRDVIIHTTKAMQVAWKMYESFGFKRAPERDFKQNQLDVFGFRLEL